MGQENTQMNNDPRNTTGDGMETSGRGMGQDSETENEGMETGDEMDDDGSGMGQESETDDDGTEDGDTDVRKNIHAARDKEKERRSSQVSCTQLPILV